VGRPRILVTNWVHGEVLAWLAAFGDVDANTTPAPWPACEVRARAADADAVLAFMPDRIDAAFLAGCPRLNIVACALKGFDNFDVEACTAAGVWLTVVPDLLTAPTAELAVGLAITLARHIRDGDAVIRSGAFEGWRPILYGSGLDGATVAIIGMGAVGRAIAARLAGFGCRILGADPLSAMPANVALVDFAGALERADYVFLAAPLTRTSLNMIDRDALARMQPHALLINVGRGSVVAERAVADALMTGRLGGYAADVFELEDWARPDRPRAIDPRLLAHPRTLFTPHLGSAVDRVRRDIAMRAAESIAEALAGGRPRDAVNDPQQARGAARRVG
jgi:phosphonate dehydrogenase